jgi:hypothetical protein
MRRKRLRCASDTKNLSAGGSIFNSGLSGLGNSLAISLSPRQAHNHLHFF